VTTTGRSPASRSRAAPDPARRRRVKASPRTPRSLLALVENSLDADQAEQVAVIDLKGKSAIADFMVVASGRNPRHIGAMAEHLKEKIKASGAPSPPIEGLANADWVLIDGGDVVVHLFRPEIRVLYNLEKMWGAALPEPDAGTAAGERDGGAGGP
jgi:ribosome-associated protein